MMRFVYTAVLWLALPWVVLRLWWRGRREPGYRRHMAERFGRYAFKPDKPVIWLHAVSVGEARAFEPLSGGKTVLHNFSPTLAPIIIST